jgi:hypothetical protein
MTLKILDPNDGTVPLYLSFADFFDINNPGDYELYEDHNYTGPVDFLIQNAIANYSNYTKYRFKQLLFLDIRHNSENQIAELHRNKTDRIVVTNARDFTIEDPRILFNDFLFNLTKAFYSNYSFTAKRVWHFKSPKEYLLPEKENVETRNKIYVAANRTYFDPDYPEQRYYRKKLMDLLKSKYRTHGYLGDPADRTVGDLPSNTRHRITGGYEPLHNKFYEDSFISIYVESLEYGTTFAATEKTFDPLIKGHFVLPFGTYRFIDNVKRYYGFQFPDFIDYSYDLIEDDEQRYQAYSAEVERLLAVPLDTWREHWNNYKALRTANQQIFRDRDYHRTDLTSILE